MNTRYEGMTKEAVSKMRRHYALALPWVLVSGCGLFGLATASERSIDDPIVISLLMLSAAFFMFAAALFQRLFWIAAHLRQCS